MIGFAGLQLNTVHVLKNLRRVVYAPKASTAISNHLYPKWDLLYDQIANFHDTRVHHYCSNGGLNARIGERRLCLYQKE